VTRPLPDTTPGPQRSAADRERARAKIARKWAYLIRTTTYVPLVHADLEQPFREMVDELFSALAGEHLEAAERVGARLIELNCVDRASLRITVDVLAGPLLTDEDTRHLPPDGVARLLGALAAGYAEALRRYTVDQQESMIRAVKAVAMKAARAAESHQSDREAIATELSLLRRQLSHQLLHDALTGLPNRQFFTTRLEEVLNSGSPTTLYRIELNGFAVLNDGLGSPPADQLLLTVAARLRSAVAGEGAMVARFGRADFVVLHEHRPEMPRPPTPPAELVRRITAALAETTYVAEHGLAVTANIGVVQSPPHRADLVELTRSADLALRLAKEQGPGRWRLLVPDEDRDDRTRLRLAAILPGALEIGELTVDYRLRVSLDDERPVAVDAYPCWHLAGVRDCTTLAEDTGLSPQVGRWLLRTAGKRMCAGELPLSVRLSPNQASAPDLVDTVLGTLTDTALPADRLQLAMPAADVFGRRALDNLSELADAGVRMAVHDFGGDPVNVARLADLPVRSVSFARELVEQARTARPLMTKALTGVTSLVHEAGATVSIDGISSKPEADWWRHTGADTATGPLFPIQGQP
jgi:diguanylate cyclase (GGDEF)-like protein